MKRSTRVAINIAAFVASCAAIALLTLLIVATSQASEFERYYDLLYWINIAVAFTLAAIVVGFSVRLALRWRQGKFGARLLTKIAVIFVLIGAIPGLVTYVVSYQFVSRSIESWFDIKVESALEAGLNLGRATLEELQNDFLNQVRANAPHAQDESALTPLALERLRTRLDASELVSFTQSGRVIGTAGGLSLALLPEVPNAAQLSKLRPSRGSISTESVAEDSNKLRMRALVALPDAAAGLGLGAAREMHYLQVLKNVPDTLARNALAVQQANSEYQTRAAARKALKRLYLGTLTLALGLALFAALLMAVLLSNQLARPLLLLAEGVKAVADGDLSPKAQSSGRDELGDLTRDFNRMTTQLADARRLAEDRQAQVEASRSTLQGVLDNMSAGVLVLDKSGDVALANPSARQILSAPLQVGTSLSQVSASMRQMVDNGFASLDENHRSFVRELTLGDVSPQEAGLAILMRGAPLLLPEGEHRCIVFDDITDLIAAQRSIAWGEVARRVAHEIKNPLTPIQLSAERLQKKLTGHLPGPEQAVLEKSVGTIVNQVDAMKRMVNDFRDYARLPPAELKSLALNELIADVVALYASDDQHCPVEVRLLEPLPLINADASQLRQVIHNLLQNAGDAVQGRSEASVVLKTELTSAEPPRVRLVVTDNGPGFDAQVLKRAFEPYVTSKPRGTGLGLAIVKKIMDEHGGRVDLRNLEKDGHPLGAQVSLTFTLSGAAAHQTAA